MSNLTFALLVICVIAVGFLSGFGIAALYGMISFGM